MAKLFHRKRRCPDDHMLAAYADQQLAGDERNQVEQHLVSCDVCLRQVGFLIRTTSDPPKEETPAALLRAARHLSQSTAAQPSRWGWLPVQAFAAILLIGASVWIFVGRSTKLPLKEVATRQPSPALPSPPVTGSSDDQVRGGGGTAQMIVAPKPGAMMPTEHARFQWTAVSGAKYYEVQVLTDAGDLVWQSRPQSTSTEMPTAVHLVAGHTYYLLVRAHSENLSVIESAPVPFTAK